MLRPFDKLKAQGTLRVPQGKFECLPFESLRVLPIIKGVISVTKLRKYNYGKAWN